MLAVSSMEPKKRRRISPEDMESAVREVVVNQTSIREVAQCTGIPRSSLHRAVKKARNATIELYQHSPNIGNRRLFSEDQELSLVNYCKTASRMCYGLTTVQARCLAYQFAKELNLTIPEKWKNDEKAGRRWLQKFMSRHRDISLRKPESCSLSRATAFNKYTVSQFFNNLETVFSRYQFSPNNIYNCDETGLLTVTDPPKIIAPCGSKQVAQISSGERGVLVTMLNFINATGNTVPPVFIFPRVHFKDYMLNGAPTGSLGLTHKTGWMTEDTFYQSLKHFAHFTKCSQDNRVLLLLDNHKSHVNVRIITFAREKGITLLTFPPHTSHRLQPLDVSVYGPFKTRFRSEQNNWLISNPGKTISIYNIAELANKAFVESFSPKNITSGFAKCGIFPFNRDIFSNDDFLTSFVTDRPNPDANSNAENRDNQGSRINILSNVLICPASVTPEQIRPFPKAPERKGNQRKQQTTKILTATPKKDEENEVEDIQGSKLSQPKVKKVKRNIVESSSSESEVEMSPEGQSDLDCSDNFDEIEILEQPDNAPFKDKSKDKEDTPQEENKGDNEEDKDTKINDFILVKFPVPKKGNVNFVGKILKIGEEIFTVAFMRRFQNKFHFPDAEDICDINKDSILKHLSPVELPGTSRMKSYLFFGEEIFRQEAIYGKIM